MSVNDNIKKTGLTPEDLVSIIRELKGSRITSLAFRGLILKQSPDAASQVGNWTSTPAPKSPDPAPPAAFSSSSTPPVEEAIELDEDDLLDLVKLEDPEAYERMLEKRELEDADNATD
jgi:hypothetical protein